MTTLVLENLAALPALMQALRVLVNKLARAIDGAVSARAARSVPEWRMRELRGEINRYRGLVRAGEMHRNDKPAEPARAAQAFAEPRRPESAICNFGR